MSLSCFAYENQMGVYAIVLKDAAFNRRWNLAFTRAQLKWLPNAALLTITANKRTKQMCYASVLSDLNSKLVIFQMLWQFRVQTYNKENF